MPTVVGSGCDQSSKRAVGEPLVEANAIDPPMDVKKTVAIDVPIAVCWDIFRPIRFAVSIGNATNEPPIPTSEPTVPAIVPMTNAPPVVVLIIATFQKNVQQQQQHNSNNQQQ